MAYQVDDRVVHASHGVGRITRVVTRQFPDLEAREYYEIAIERNTVWVPVDSTVPQELRLLTPKAELARYRAILLEKPAVRTPDHRQRRLELINRLKLGARL